MSALLDAAGGPAAEGAADLLVAGGVVAAVPTAAARRVYLRLSEPSAESARGGLATD